MVLLGFKEQFAGPVEAGTKRQTIRQAKCINKYCSKKEGALIFRQGEPIGEPNCYFVCQHYKPRIKPGDTLQLYTGLRQKKYCKCKPPVDCDIWEEGRICNSPYTKENRGRDCHHQGAKLLKTATCTESFPIKFEDLTEEIARLAGFTMEMDPSFKRYATALERLKEFLRQNYDAKDGDVFQVIRWQ